jgi:glucose-1-phosphate cytidylyltransferase
LKSKPAIKIGGKVILKFYFSRGITDFIICFGYCGCVIKEYLAICFLHMSNVAFNMAINRLQVHEQKSHPWKVTLVDARDKTGTVGRLKRVSSCLRGENAFCFTYGDGIANVDIRALTAFRDSHGNWAILTAAQPPGRYSAIEQESRSGFGAWSCRFGAGGASGRLHRSSAHE